MCSHHHHSNRINAWPTRQQQHFQRCYEADRRLVNNTVVQTRYTQIGICAGGKTTHRGIELLGLVKLSTLHYMPRSRQITNNKNMEVEKQEDRRILDKDIWRNEEYMENRWEGKFKDRITKGSERKKKQREWGKWTMNMSCTRHQRNITDIGATWKIIWSLHQHMGSIIAISFL